jgi:prolyl-tRNA synthetase
MPKKKGKISKEEANENKGKEGGEGKGEGREKDKRATLGITAEKDDFSEWFTQLMLKSGFMDYSEVSGCMIFRPPCYAIWENLVRVCDEMLKRFGVENCYFPLFIPEKLLAKEAEHVEGFSPEVAWVTEAGKSKLAERLAVRPTSEAIMYAAFSKWIRSYRDLPLRLNQWNNVVRWEFKHPVPLFRTREFLWNELHAVYASHEEAVKEGMAILNAYKEICENYLALYGLIGKKTEEEKFAGAIASWKLHYILPNGRIIEGPCFHDDGQNFAKAYDIQFLDKEGKKQYAWQTTFAISTRMLGTMFAIHSDNKGLVLPPKIAPKKVVIVPIYYGEEKEKVLEKARELEKLLQAFNAFVDDREQYTPGYKFNEHELKGIPIRIEIGKKEIEAKQIVLFRRDTLSKEVFKYKSNKDIVEKVKKLCDEIQHNLFEKSKQAFYSKIEEIKEADDAMQKLAKIIEAKKVALIPLCKGSCEEKIKESLSAKVVFIDVDRAVNEEKCLICKNKADYFVYVGKTY